MRFMAEEMTARQAACQSLSHTAPLRPHTSQCASKPTDEPSRAQGAANALPRHTELVRGRVQTPGLAAVSLCTPSEVSRSRGAVVQRRKGSGVSKDES